MPPHGPRTHGVDALTAVVPPALLTVAPTTGVEVVERVVGEAAPRVATCLRAHAPATGQGTSVRAVAAYDGPVPHLAIRGRKLGARTPHAAAGVPRRTIGERQVLEVGTADGEAQAAPAGPRITPRVGARVRVAQVPRHGVGHAVVTARVATARP